MGYAPHYFLLAIFGYEPKRGVGGRGEQIHALTETALCVCAQGRSCRYVAGTTAGQHAAIGNNTRGTA